jgi:hypothetical protein
VARRRSTVCQSQVTSAIKGALKGGANVRAIEITADGRIVIRTAPDHGAENTAADLDRELADFEASKWSK